MVAHHVLEHAAVGFERAHTFVLGALDAGLHGGTAVWPQQGDALGGGVELSVVLFLLGGCAGEQ